MKIPVLLPNIFDHPFTYETDSNLKTGDYVNVPFGNSILTGVIWDHFENSQKKSFNLKKILNKINIDPLNKKTINFLNWFSEYNLIPKGMSLKLHLASGKAVEKFSSEEYKFYKANFDKHSFNLNNEQLDAYNEMSKNSENFRVHLLQGATGSGKTLVYFNIIKKKIEKGYQALILLPEIGLTGEFEKKFKEFFGFNAAVWHSGISPKRKKIIWSGLASKNIKVVIGARSALFLPFKKLGIIIVDEEHDQSFKQDEGVIYNARDMAISRASFENIPINLVTAVPSVETFENVKKKKYSISKLVNRYANASFPSFEIVDLNKFKPSKKSWISSKIIIKAKKHLENGDQILFFINRRGFSPYVLCKNCLKVFSCPNCSINLVYHYNTKKLLCHYCGYKNNLKRDCNKNISGSCKFIFSGAGVERIYEEINNFFPKYKSAIFSSDVINKKSGADILKKIINNEIKILVGTQLISKGFHFPNLNCIVVLDIDLSSRGHDLRASEKNLQLYHQLSGRAGRAGNPAVVYFQTYNLDEDLISEITNDDPFLFLDKELVLRKKNNLPPFERFVSLILTSKNQKKLDKDSIKLKEILLKNKNFKILGPVNAPIYRIKKQYRNRLLIRSKKNVKIQKILKPILNRFKLSFGIKLTVDVDPISFN